MAADFLEVGPPSRGNSGSAWPDLSKGAVDYAKQIEGQFVHGPGGSLRMA